MNSPRRAPHLLMVLLLTALLGSLLVTVSAGPSAAGLSAGLSTAVPASGPAAARGPRQDFPRMPRSCATPRQKIPLRPVTCQLNRFDVERPTVVLWGDSHAWMFIPALRRAARDENVNLVAVMMGTCPPMDNRVGVSSEAPACFRSNALGLQAVRRLEGTGEPYRVVLGASWQRYRRALAVGDRSSYTGRMALAMRRGTPRLVRTLRTIGARVDVLGQVATVPEQHRFCKAGNNPYACQLPRAKALPRFASTRRWLTRTTKPLLGSRKPIDVNPFICTAAVCRGKVGRTRTWFDDLHLSASMSARMSRYLEPTVAAVVPGPAAKQASPPDLCGPIPVPILC